MKLTKSKAQYESEIKHIKIRKEELERSKVSAADNRDD